MSDNGVRPVNQPKPVIVETSRQGLPRYVSRRGTRRQVTSIEDVWRIDDEWWREPISRRYYALVLDGDLDLTVYEDLVTGEWFEQRY